MGSRTKTPLRSDFNVGGAQAEADPLLQESFYESGHFAAAVSKADARCFIIGRTGSGKSALLRRLEEVKPEHVVRINPEDLALPYITNLQVFRFLEALEVHLDPLFIALWKHVLLVEVLKKRYRNDSEAAKSNVLGNIRDKIRRDSGKQAALDYLDEFEGRFWCEADERIKDITEKFEERIKDEAKGSIGLKGLATAGFAIDAVTSLTLEERMEERQRFQRIVNDTQLARLAKMLAVLDEDILVNQQHFTYVVIDDLDRNWIDEHLTNDLIWCLFRTVLDLKRVRNLKVLVALRTNIFEELRFSQRARGQEEKFRSLILPIRWTPRGLHLLMDERVRASASHWGVEFNSVGDLLPPTSRTKGSPFEFVVQHTLYRPRDVIAFMNGAIQEALGKTRLAWKDLEQTVPSYSRGRLMALRDEWKTTYAGIDRVFEVFRRAPAVIDRDQLALRLDEVALLPADPSFEGTVWVTERSVGLWSASGGGDWSDEYGPPVDVLFEIGLLGVAPDRSRKPRFVHDEPIGEVPDSAVFHVHPAYRAALEVK